MFFKKASNYNSNKYRRHAVTVLLQDYFHRGLFKQVIGEKQWSRFENRLNKNVGNTLSLFRRFNINATFFSLGWIADNYPEIIRTIVAEGHEIASAGYWARSVHEMKPQEFREDIRRSSNALERAGANKIIGYRSAFKWIKKEDLWALDILAEEGYFYDASYRPAWISIKEKPFHKFAHKYPTRTSSIWEFPTSTSSILGLNVPISGGSYIRQIPHFFMFHYFKKWCKETEAPFVLYFHPWELDAQQPEITAVGRFSRIRQYRNLGKMELILPTYFKEGSFQSISQYLEIPLEYPDTSVSRLQPPTSNLTCPVKFSVERSEADLTGVPVTIIIPCYNEESSLPYLTKALDELCLESKEKYDLEFIFVDDNSTDGTYIYLQSKFGSNKDCWIIQHDKNRGVASAIRTGLSAAKTDIVCSIDADCSYDPMALLKMIPLLEDGVDMVTASPYHPNGFVFGVPKWRLLLSKSLSKIYHFLLRNKLSTYTSCFRVYRQSSSLKNDTKYGDFRGIIELVTLMDITGGVIKEFPTTLQSRIFGYSKMKIFQTIIGHIILFANVVKYSRSQSRSHYNKEKRNKIINKTETKVKEHKNTSGPHRKKIWIDLDNSPHVPFFNPIIKEMKQRGYFVTLTARDCFQVCGLAELYGLKYKRIGRHYGKNKILKILGTFFRSIQLFPTILGERVVLAVSHGSRSQLIAAKLLGIESVIIFDYEFTQGLGPIVPDWVIGPEIIPVRGHKNRHNRILRYSGIKEDVYVPLFKPDSKILTELELNDEDLLVTIRPPATEAHYHNPESEKLFIAVVEFLLQNQFVRLVILPRNEKKQTAWIKNMWSEFCQTGKIIIPDHPVSGLNLIWHSDFVVSGGGTMNREAAALGVPVYSIFRGKIGAVDRYLSSNGRLTLLENVEDVKTKLKVVPRDKSINFQKRNEDTLQMITDHLIEILNKR